MKKLMILLPLLAIAYAQDVHFSPLISSVSHSYKDLRDLDIEKQDLDYSCGSASMATILKSFYNRPTTEKEVLDKLIKINTDGVATFDGLQKVAGDFGYKAVGVSINFAQLSEFKVPAIIYLNAEGNDHFSVVRGINDNGTVHLGDSSWGNIKFKKDKFLSMWEQNGVGKVLVIIPQSKNISLNRDFFQKPRENTNAIRAITDFR